MPAIAKCSLAVAHRLGDVMDVSGVASQRTQGRKVFMTANRAIQQVPVFFLGRWRRCRL